MPGDFSRNPLTLLSGGCLDRELHTLKSLSVFRAKVSITMPEPVCVERPRGFMQLGMGFSSGRLGAR